MLPKLLLAPMRMYLRMLAKTLRPSMTPCSSTSRLFSSRIMSADSLAMSTAVSTLMPTSAARRAGASLMPSPMKPTVCPRACSAWMIRCLSAGETRANSVVARRRRRALHRSSPRPARRAATRSVERPTSLQIFRATRSLSPVTTLTLMPCSLQRLRWLRRRSPSAGRGTQRIR